VRIEGILQVGLRLTDPDASIVFYRDVLGLKFMARFDPPGLIFFDAGGVRLLLERNGAPGILYYRVPAIETAVTELRAKGITIDSPPHMIHRDEAGTFGLAGTEDWMAFCKDPSGNTLGLVERRPPGGSR
jgi:methylmalonyl-CoA/ethylmalonyl-CoA epimerase